MKKTREEMIYGILEYHSHYSGFTQEELKEDEAKLNHESTVEIVNIWNSCFPDNKVKIEVCSECGEAMLCSNCDGEKMINLVKEMIPDEFRRGPY